MDATSHENQNKRDEKRKENHCLSVPKRNPRFQHTRGSSVCGLPFAFCWEARWHLWEEKLDAMKTAALKEQLMEGGSHSRMLEL